MRHLHAQRCSGCRRRWLIIPTQARLLAAIALVACGGKEGSSGIPSPSTTETAAPTPSASVPAEGATGQGATGQGSATGQKASGVPNGVGASCPASCAADSDCAGCAPRNANAVLCCDRTSAQCYESVQSVCNLPSPGVVGSVDAGTTDHCAGAVHLALGGSISGTTCGGKPVPGSSPCKGQGAAAVWVYVDAPDGTALTLTFAPGTSVFGFAACDSETPLECNGSATSFQPIDPGYRLFALARADTACGTFTLSAAAN